MLVLPVSVFYSSLRLPLRALLWRIGSPEAKLCRVSVGHGVLLLGSELGLGVYRV